MNLKQLFRQTYPLLWNRKRQRKDGLQRWIWQYSYVYDAWGRVTSIYGTYASTIGQINPIRYRGYYYDNESDFYYLNSRYYDPQIKRFINADSIIGANGSIVGYNLYTYCDNNTIVAADYTGLIRVVSKDVYVLGSLASAIFAVTYLSVTTIITAPKESPVSISNKNQPEKKDNFFYVLKNPATKEIMYVGRTKNPKAREIAHKANPYKRDLEFVILFENLTYEEARANENYLILALNNINVYDRMRNRIRGIAPNEWDRYIKYAQKAQDFVNDRLENEILY